MNNENFQLKSYFGLRSFFVPTSLLQWLPVILKKVCKWVLLCKCLAVIKIYYRNLRFMSITWKIWIFITFNIAMVGSVIAVQLFFIESFPYILKSLKETHCFRISFNLELYQKYTPPRMFREFLGEKMSVKCNQTPIS